MKTTQWLASKTIDDTLYVLSNLVEYTIHPSTGRSVGGVVRVQDVASGEYFTRHYATLSEAQQVYERMQS